MPATSSPRQAFPRWQIARSEAAVPPAPARGAKVIPFPAARARRAAVVTYPASLVLPARRAVDAPMMAPGAIDGRLRLAAGAAVGAALLLLVLL